MYASRMDTIDLRGKTYTEIDAYVKAWCDLPPLVNWKDIHVQRPLYGTVSPKKKHIVQDAMVIGHAGRGHILTTLEDRTRFLNSFPYKYFRTAESLQIIFQTDKGLRAHRHPHTACLIFITGTYSESYHMTNIAILERLADVWNDGRILSIVKDYTTGPESNDADHLFVRPFAAVLVVRLAEE